MTKTITKDELFELMESDGVIDLDDTPTKHDCSYVTFVVPKDGKHWLVGYSRSYNNGIEDDHFNMVEVEPKEVKTVEWVKVK